MRPARLLSIVVLGAVACGLDAAGTLDLASTTGGDAGPDATPPLDAAGLIDASGLDAAGLIDASGLDASSDGDASPVAFCAGQTDPSISQCWDFEAPATSIGTFDPQPSDGTTAVVAAGGSQAMSITLPVGMSARGAWVRKAIGAFGVGATTYEIRFRFAIPADTLDSAALGGFRDSFGSIFGVESYGQGAAIKLSVTPPMATAVPTSAGPAWHTAAVEIHQGVVRPTAKVTIDGTVVFNDVWDVGPSPILDLRLGAYYTSSNSGAYQILFDDVLIRHQ